MKKVETERETVFTTSFMGGMKGPFRGTQGFYLFRESISGSPYLWKIPFTGIWGCRDEAVGFALPLVAGVHIVITFPYSLPRSGKLAN